MKPARCKHMATIGLRLVLLGFLICLQALALDLSAGPAAGAPAATAPSCRFRRCPSASIAGPRLQDSVHKRRAEPKHLHRTRPTSSSSCSTTSASAWPTFGGEIHTPTLTRLANEGISYNAFHTTSICSPTRAALLTGRNHQRVGSGTIAERAVDWDGYTGVIPEDLGDDRRGAARLRLQDRGLRQMAQHAGDRDHGDGTVRPLADRHMASTTSTASSPARPRNGSRAWSRTTTPIEPPHDDRSTTSARTWRTRRITWLRKHRAFAPDKPFLMYWAPGAAHGPHHIFKEWADKYKGKFDDGWDAYRERVFKRQKELGWIPADTKLTPRAETMAGVGQHSRVAAAVPARG